MSTNTETKTLSEVRQLLAVSRSTVYRLRQDGELDVLYVRSRPRVTRRSIDAYLSRQLQFAAGSEAR